MSWRRRDRSPISDQKKLFLKLFKCATIVGMTLNHIEKFIGCGETEALMAIDEGDPLLWRVSTEHLLQRGLIIVTC